MGNGCKLEKTYNPAHLCGAKLSLFLLVGISGSYGWWMIADVRGKDLEQQPPTEDDVRVRPYSKKLPIWPQLG